MVKGAASSQEEITLMEFKHPKYYKELRKRNRSFLLRKEECTLGKLGNSRLEETSSDKPYQINYDDFCKGDEEAPSESSSKPQAPSSKPQASSLGGPAHNQAPDVKKKI